VIAHSAGLRRTIPLVITSKDDGVKMKLTMLSSILACLVLSCPSTEYNRWGDLQVRVENKSNTLLENVTITYENQVEIFGNIPPGVITEYHTVKKLTNFANIEAIANGKRIAEPQGIDKLGEEVLGKGKYTYSLTLDENNAPMNKVWIMAVITKDGA
jgi:hypothetical protein